MAENELQSVIQGLNSHVRDVKENAKQDLARLAREVSIPYTGSYDISPDTVRDSIRFSFDLYKYMRQSKDIDRNKMFLKMLLSIGGRGPFFAWKYFAHGDIHHNLLIDSIRQFPDQLRLVLAYNYTLDTISVRRKFGLMIRSLLKDVKERDAVFEFLVYLYDQGTVMDFVFDDLCKRLNVHESIIHAELCSPDPEIKIRGIKAVGALGDKTGYEACEMLLSSEDQPQVIICCLEMLSKTNAKNKPSIINAISPHLKSGNPAIAAMALRAIILLKDFKPEQLAALISPAVMETISGDEEFLNVLKWPELNIVLKALTPGQAREVRSIRIKSLICGNPEKLKYFLNLYAGGANSGLKEEAQKLLAQIDTIQKNELEQASLDDLPEYKQPEVSKGFFDKLTGNKSLKKILGSKNVQREDFHGEIFSDTDFSGINFRETNFNGALFKNVDLSSSKMYLVSFEGAYFENVTMDNADISTSSFKNAVMNNVTFSGSTSTLCDFSESWIYNSAFDSASVQFSIFGNARIKKTDFTDADLTDTSFIGAELILSRYNSACLHLSDFSLVNGIHCDFVGANISTAAIENSSINVPCEEMNDLVFPDSFFDEDNLDAEGFKILVLSGELESQREKFIEYNNRKIELAIDTLSPEQGDLFELLPFLVHTSMELLPHGNPVKDAPAGICDYFPSKKMLQLAKKYLPVDDSQPILNKERSIDGLFSIGSIGSIAQAYGSDIDCWVCLEEEKLGPENIKLLTAKLQAIEIFSDEKFNTEVHFFIVDLPSVREDRYGGSDQESSGSAQGKILKEEFYRTMLHIAGKIPLWAVVPPSTDDNAYKYYNSIAERFPIDYFDIGSISAIPKGEYFGATIWQIFKSLKSPYKSVIKMSLLEKYIQDEGQQFLLCDKLKSDWSSGRGEMLNQDPYLMLFNEVLEYHRSIQQKEVELLLLICFYLKLGDNSFGDLEKLVLGARKRLVLDFMKGDSWTKIQAMKLGDFNQWSFDKILWLGTQISNYMIKTYKKLSLTLQKLESNETKITPEDMTILGRKMFVQFSKQQYKVEKLPFLVHDKEIFGQLYLRLNQDEKGHASWYLIRKVVSLEKTQKQSGEEILKKMDRIEEIAIWFVFNGLYYPTTLFKLMPNPSPISVQDTINLIRDLYDFFPLKDTSNIGPKALLENRKVRKIFVVLNFNISRKKKSIHEYTAIYTTTWGEYFCRTFVHKEGFLTVEKALAYVRKQFNIGFPAEKIGVYIPQLAKKYISMK